MISITALPVKEVNKHVYRVIPSRFPQISLYERVAAHADWDVLHSLEDLTNQRLRETSGSTRLVAPQDRIYGEGASFIMAPFTHPPVDTRGGRFNQDFGIYYCSPTESVSIQESAAHRARFLEESGIEEASLEMRVVRARLGPVELHDVRHLKSLNPDYPGSHKNAQQLGLELRDAGSHGIRFNAATVKGECFAIMRPSPEISP